MSTTFFKFFRSLSAGAGASRQRVCILLSSFQFVNPFFVLFYKKYLPLHLLRQISVSQALKTYLSMRWKASLTRLAGRARFMRM